MTLQTICATVWNSAACKHRVGGSALLHVIFGHLSTTHAAHIASPHSDVLQGHIIAT